MSSTKYLILGGGMVAGYAAKELAAQRLKSGELAIVSAADALPYERPSPSKGFLAGKETQKAITINPSNFYRKHGIQIKLGVTVETVDLKTKHLGTRSGEKFEFEKLVLA